MRTRKKDEKKFVGAEVYFVDITKNPVYKFWRGVEELFEKENAKILWGEGPLFDEFEEMCIRGSKYIIQVKEKTDAEKIQEKIMRSLAKFKLDYKIKIKIKPVAGKIKLTVSDVPRVEGVFSKEKVLQFVSKYCDVSKEELLIKLQEELTEKQYKIFKYRAHAYRVTYYDTEEKKRKQAAVGDVFFAVGEGKIEVNDADIRKTRSDKAKVLEVFSGNEQTFYICE